VERVEAGVEHEASSMRATVILAVTAVLIYIADQVTKALVVASLDVGERVQVIGDLVWLWHLRNTGAAFSLLPGAIWLFVPITILALGMVAWFHRQFRDRGPWIHVILGVVLGGTLGNLTDRLRFGYVVDFVSVGVGDLRWPAFNVADPSVVIGIGVLVVYLTFFDARERREPVA
jgi:signal peptidase II